MVSELLSSYYADIELLEYAEQQEAKKEEVVERKPQLSWLLTLILLLVVTVVCILLHILGLLMFTLGYSSSL